MHRVCQAILISFRLIREGITARTIAGHTKKSNLKCQAFVHNALASIGMSIAMATTDSIENDERPHGGVVYDISSVENDTGYSSTGYSTHDEDEVQTAKTLNDETEDGCSSVDEQDARIAGANKKAKF